METIDLPEEVTAIAEKYDGFIDVGGSRYEMGKLHEGISNYAYQRSLGLGSTSIKNFLPESPAPRNFQAYRDGEVEFTGGAAVRIGTTLHALTLTPITWQDEIQLWPEFPQGKKTKGKEELQAANPHITFIDEDELFTAQSMHDVLMRQPEMIALMTQITDMRTGIMAGQVEVSGWYNDLHPLTGEGTYQLCKYRPDMRFCPDWAFSTWLGDIKSTKDASPEGFRRAIQEFGYHISAAHYLEGDYILHGRKPRQFIFICQENTPPYLCAFYVLGEPTLKYGEYLRRKALDGIYECKKHNQWPHYADGNATVIDLPQYVLNRMEK